METMNVDEANRAINKATRELMKLLKGKLSPKVSQENVRKELKSCFADLLLRKVVIVPSREKETETEKVVPRPKADNKKRDESPLHFPPMDRESFV